MEKELFKNPKVTHLTLSSPKQARATYFSITIVTNVHIQRHIIEPINKIITFNLKSSDQNTETTTLSHFQ